MVSLACFCFDDFEVEKNTRLPTAFIVLWACGPDKAFRQELVSLKDEVEETSHSHTTTYPSLLSTATRCTTMHYAIMQKGMTCTDLMILLAFTALV